MLVESLEIKDCQRLFVLTIFKWKFHALDKQTQHLINISFFMIVVAVFLIFCSVFVTDCCKLFCCFCSNKIFL